MFWVDCETYFGPDRRRAVAMFRLRERRRVNLAMLPPPLGSSLRQLRMRVFDACNADGVKQFAARVRGVAQLADINGEHRVSSILVSMARQLTARTGETDVREHIYSNLDHAHSALRAA